MSQQATPTATPAVTPAEALTKMSADEARDFLTRELFAPIFFDKLASRGLCPENEAEALVFMDMGAKLLNAKRLENTKTAGTRLDFLKQASGELDNAIAGRFGTPAPQQKSAEDLRLRQDAASLAGHAQVRAAVLALNA